MDQDSAWRAWSNQALIVVGPEAIPCSLTIEQRDGVTSHER